MITRGFKNGERQKKVLSSQLLMAFVLYLKENKQLIIIMRLGIIWEWRFILFTIIFFILLACNCHWLNRDANSGILETMTFKFGIRIFEMPNLKVMVSKISELASLFSQIEKCPHLDLCLTLTGLSVFLLLFIQTASVTQPHKRIRLSFSVFLSFSLSLDLNIQAAFLDPDPRYVLDPPWLLDPPEVEGAFQTIFAPLGI